MPQIIVTADQPSEDGVAVVMFRERVTARDFECEHLAAQLLQRVEWAVGDAHEAEQTEPEQEKPEQAKSKQAKRTRPARPGRQRRSASVVTTASYTPAP